jgi:hypothetical protein
VHARYRRPGQGRVVLRGFRQGRAYKEVLDVTLPDTAREHAAIASMWARARVDELMWRDLAGLQSGNVDAAVREQIVEIALAHRLVTQFTSFVAVEERVVNQGGKQVRVTVPVEMPQGVSHEGVFGGETESSDARRPMAKAGDTVSRLRALGYGTAAPPRTEPAPAAAAREDDAKKTEIGTLARQRLASELLALLEGSGTVAVRVTDGRVTVKIVLRGLGVPTVRRLERAGLRVTQMGGTPRCASCPGWVIASVAVESLAVLAEDQDVVRVELP